MVVFSAPSKTFLLGEYAVLHGYSALLINTTPRFELHIEKGFGELINIHPKSPSAQFFKDNFSFFQTYKITFLDPYIERGGFGASSAQFLMLYHFCFPNSDLKNLIEIYKKYYGFNGATPSGADIAAQYTGGITYVESPTASSLPWPFENVCFGLFHTGKKILTHEHLQHLNLSKNLTSELNHLTQIGAHAFKKNNADLLMAAVSGYAQTLNQANLTSEHTQLLLKQLDQLNWVLSAKGCGALGNDVILVLFTHEHRAHFKNWCEQQKLFYLTNEQLSSLGLAGNLNEMVNARAI